MKKYINILLLIAIAMVGLISCNKSIEKESEVEQTSEVKNESETKVEDNKETVKLGTSVLGKELIEYIEPYFEENSDYDLDVQVFEDFVLPNTATVEGSLDVNVYQYEPYLDQYNADNGTNLKSYAKTFGLIEGVYSSKIDSLEKLEDSAKVGLIGYPSNKAVALRILQDEGLIKLDPNVEIPNVTDIIENPKNLEFIEMNDGRSLAMAIDDFDIIQTSGINMQMSGYDPKEYLAIASDEIHDELAFCIVVKEENLNADWLDDLERALNSEKMVEYIKENYEGSYFLLGDM